MGLRRNHLHSQPCDRRPPLTDLSFFGATTVLLGFLLVISLTDLRSLRIPDNLTLPLAAMGLLAGPPLRGNLLTDHLWGMVAGFVIIAAIGEAYFRRYGREGLGLGDAKLIGAAGAWLGWQALPMLVLISASAALLFLLVRRPSGGGLPFGPWIALGVALLWLLPAGLPFNAPIFTGM